MKRAAYVLAAMLAAGCSKPPPSSSPRATTEVHSATEHVAPPATEHAAPAAPSGLAAPDAGDRDVASVLGVLRAKPGVVGAALAPNRSDRFVVSVCAREAAAGLEAGLPPGTSLDVTVAPPDSRTAQGEPCGCVSRGIYYRDREGVPSIDGCNACGCNQGSITCTLLECKIVIVERLAFAHDVTALDADAAAKLDAVAAALKSLPDRRVRIIGYADGAETDPIAVSTTRAKAAFDGLVARGIDPKRLTLRGVGNHEPLGGNEPVNRAVRFELDPDHF